VVLPVIGLVWFLFSYIRGIQRMDEVQRRIHLEAAVVAFCLSVLLMMVLGLLSLVVELNPKDWSYTHLVPFLFLGYFIGLFRAKRKYS
jgi:H+/Cl- antiporter ClcA